VISWYIKTASVTHFPGAVLYMFETCDEWDAIVPRWTEYDLGRIRSYKASIPIVSFTYHCNTIPIYTRDSGEYMYSGWCDYDSIYTVY